MSSWFNRSLVGAVCLWCASSFPAPTLRAQGSQVEEEASPLAVRKVRDALAVQRIQLARSPKDAAKYVDLAYTLIDAGMTDASRAVLQQATEALPESPFILNAQGWVLHHNSVGVDYGKGFDYDGSIASYRKAILLTPMDMDVRQSFANVLEHNRYGVRYAPDADLAAAIEEYRYVKEKQAVVDAAVEDNLIIALFYAGRYREALAEVATLAPSMKREGVAISSLTALEGSAAGIEFAAKITGTEQMRSDALNFAAEGVWTKQLYKQAADLMSSSLSTNTDASVINKITLFRGLKPYSDAALSASDPRSSVRRLIAAGVMNAITDSLLQECTSQHAYPSEAARRQDMEQDSSLVEAAVRNLMKKTGLPQIVIRDIVMEMINISAEPSANEKGVRITVQLGGKTTGSYYVMNEGGAYKIVASEPGGSGIGTETLYLLQNKQAAAAAALLDWKRDLTAKQRNNDPLDGPLFFRLWPDDVKHGPQEIKMAAASLLTSKAEIAMMLPEVLAARKEATTEVNSDTLDLLLATMYIRLEDGVRAKPIAERLLARHKDSDTAVVLAGEAYAETSSLSEWQTVIASALQERPEDRTLLVQSALEAETEGDFSRARSTMLKVMHGRDAVPNDYNLYAWLSLFEDHVDNQALTAARQANLMAGNENYAYLHTLACLNAAQGQVAEARELLLEAMDRGMLEEPNGPIWYGFGRIYEQYAETDAAIAAYKHVNKPEGKTNAVDVYFLAQTRLKALHVE